MGNNRIRDWFRRNQGFPVAQIVKNPPTMQETWVWSLDWEDPLEREQLSKYHSVISFSHVQLFNPMDCSLPGCSVYGILQARILAWVAVPFFRVSSQPRDPSQIYHMARGFFTVWTSREAQEYQSGEPLQRGQQDERNCQKKHLCINKLRNIFVKIN